MVKKGDASRREHPLKMNAYLKLKVNPRKGVLSWEEIKASEVPKNAAEKSIISKWS